MGQLLARRQVFALGIALFAALPLVANPYTLFIGNLVFIYVILALGLNLLIGYAGQLAFANAAMFGIGAYGTGLLQLHFGLPYYVAFPGGAVLAMTIGSAMAFPALRLSGLYLALATLAFAQFTQWVLLHWEPVTFGAGGKRLPTPDFSPLSATHGIYYLSLVFAVALYLIASNVVRSSIGRAFVAIRDGEVAAESLGVDLLRYKLAAFALSGLYAGIAGALYSATINYIAPEGYDLFQMVLHKAMVVVGGIGSLAGSVVGATALVVLLEVLREFKGTQEIVFGALLLFFVVFMPDGIVAWIKARLPGWEEPVRRAAPAPRPNAGEPARPAP